MFASYSTPVGLPGSSLMQTAGEKLDDYWSLPILPPTADVLAFWKTNTSTCPQLAELARATFGIPSGSASAERCFSVAATWYAKTILQIRTSSSNCNEITYNKGFEAIDGHLNHRLFSGLWWWHHATKPATGTCG